MKLLALDTCTGHISVSFYDGTTTHSINKLGDAKSSSLILPMVNEVLDGFHLADLDGLVYAKGPGAFTGIRVGISVIQALSIAHNLPTQGFSSLQILEFGAKKKYPNNKIICAIDARMDEVYWRYDNNEGLDKPENLPSLTDYIGVGTGFQTYGNFTNCKQTNGDFYPLAENLIYLALEQQNFNFDLPSPLYLRNNVAKKSTQK
jgi:tRNA threonylcarbamoyladenosine biosynthesis protein TsaB